MSTFVAVQFVAFLIYVILISVVLRYARAEIKKFFVIYLVASALWSLASFLSNSDLPLSRAIFWGKWVPFAASWTIVAYSHFVAVFIRRATRLVSRLGYAYLVLVVVLIVLGYVPENFVLLDNGLIYKDYGEWLYLLTLGGAVFMGTAIFLLVRDFRASQNPEHRNRLIYLLTGLSFLVIFGIVFEAAPVQTFAVDHLGHLGNALVLTYAIMRHQLPDMKLVVRRGIVYTGITTFISAFYLILTYSSNYLLQTWTATTGMAAIVALVILMALVFNPIRMALEKAADRLFYGKRYDYRQTVLSFAGKMGNVLDMEELARTMLAPITNAVRASQASLLFGTNGYFTVKFAERLSAEEPVVPLNLRRDSPIVIWLQKKDRPLFRETIEIEPEFKALWQEDRNALEAAEIELLCPVKSKSGLVAILALSRKQPRGFYSSDDTDLLMTLASEAAVAIENAQLYASAKERANTDELTGLFNHRYFHQRLDEEIARCSRFGDVFSLIFLDLDLFKSYNDVYGHLAGDEILKQLGPLIREAGRTVDICFRYGGDEFAAILPQTSLEGAVQVAERIQKSVEGQTDWEGVPLTCSIGIASWPTDGVMRAEIIQAADAALYYAKKTGKNRVCLACEVALSEVLRMEVGLNPDNKSAILSTIYALAATVDAKDHHTYGHSKKVSKYATDIAEALGYTKDGIERIKAAALLHDIGKIGVPDWLLAKQEPLTTDEREQIRAHPNLGVAILKHVASLKDCLAAVQYHHERFDGTGYPAGLKGNNIPMDARILALADAYDAMTSDRPYRPAKMTTEQALRELRRCSGDQFDPTIVSMFTGLNKSSQSIIVRDKPAGQP